MQPVYNESCSVCNDPFHLSRPKRGVHQDSSDPKNKILIPSCGHAIHLDCYLKQQQGNQDFCNICRAPFDKSVIPLKALIQKAFSSGYDEAPKLFRPIMLASITTFIASFLIPKTDSFQTHVLSNFLHLTASSSFSSFLRVTNENGELFSGLFNGLFFGTLNGILYHRTSLNHLISSLSFGILSSLLLAKSINKDPLKLGSTRVVRYTLGASCAIISAIKSIKDKVFSCPLFSVFS